MKVIIATLLGAALFGAATYGLLAMFANWYGPRYIRSDADINAVFLPMFVVQVVSVAAGAALGFWWARRQRGQARGKT
jgi:hypothetical protein